MNCERCVKDTHVEQFHVDGFTGYLCPDCKRTWDQLLTP